MTLGNCLPAFDEATSWIDHPVGSAQIAGSPVLVHFWSSGCPLCHEGARDVARWRRRFSTFGLATIAVYQPRPNEAIDEAAVARDARALMSIDYPCAVDGLSALAARFGSAYPPGYYLFDRHHRLRHRQMGNADIHRLEGLIERCVVKASPARGAY